MAAMLARGGRAASGGGGGGGIQVYKNPDPITAPAGSSVSVTVTLHGTGGWTVISGASNHFTVDVPSTPGVFYGSYPAWTYMVQDANGNTFTYSTGNIPYSGVAQ